MTERLNLAAESRRDRKRLDGESMSQREEVETRRRIEATLAVVGEPHSIGGVRLAIATCALTLVLGIGGYSVFHRDADLVATAGAACVHYRDSVVSVAEDCRAPVELARGHDVINVKPGTVLSESKAGIRVRHGEAVFFVHKRDGGEAFRVLVSHGSIEVVGTEFYVKQGDDGGSVHLANGHIVFRDEQGNITYMQPGDDMVWPRPPQLEPPPLQAPEPMVHEAPLQPPPPRPQPRTHVASAPRTPHAPSEPKAAAEKVEAEPTPEAPPKPAHVEADDADDAPAAEPQDEKPLSMDEVLKKMNQLRSQHRYSDAATLLRQQVMRDDFTKVQRARLSFELGTLLQDRLDDRTAACRHWHEHQMLFPNDTEHADQVQKAVESCDGNAK